MLLSPKSGERSTIEPEVVARDSDSAALLPCPFCRCVLKPYQMEPQAFSHGEGDCYFAGCIVWQPDFDAWNRRVPWLPSADVETLRGILDYLDGAQTTAYGNAARAALRALLERLTP
jgi:hypothetical protein